MACISLTIFINKIYIATKLVSQKASKTGKDQVEGTMLRLETFFDSNEYLQKITRHMIIISKEGEYHGYILKIEFVTGCSENSGSEDGIFYIVSSVRFEGDAEKQMIFEFL